MREIVGRVLGAAAPYEIAITLVAGIVAVIAWAIRTSYALRERALKQANPSAVRRIVEDEIRTLGLVDTEKFTDDDRFMLVEEALHRRGDRSGQAFKLSALVALVTAVLAVAGLTMAWQVIP